MRINTVGKPLYKQSHSLLLTEYVLAAFVSSCRMLHLNVWKYFAVNIFSVTHVLFDCSALCLAQSSVDGAMIAAGSPYGCGVQPDEAMAPKVGG